MTREKGIIYSARIVSALFNPFYLPVVGMILLFALSDMNQLPISYRLQIILLTYVFTAFMPTLFIALYRRYQGWTLIQLGYRQRRMVPYIIAMVCYLACAWVLYANKAFYFCMVIVLASLVVQVVCALVNVWWKISTHSAAIGGVTGALIFFANYYHFNPVWWLALVLLLAGVLGTARIILRQHSLSQVLGGFGVGLVCAIVSFLLL